MTTIKNKQTGETLTGESIPCSVPQPADYFYFKINGCRYTYTLTVSEWDILPPPLPTGIGAVVKDTLGRRFVRIDSGEYPWFQHERERSGWSDKAIAELSLTVLSEGVPL